MQRRHLLTGAAAFAAGRSALPRPALGGTSKTLIHVPQANLTNLDPVWTTAIVTRNSVGMIFETLFGRDEQLNPRPQMLAGYVTEDDGLRWTMTLRDGLLFHDGSKVLAQTASPRCAAGCAAIRSGRPSPRDWMRWRRRTTGPLSGG